MIYFSVERERRTDVGDQMVMVVAPLGLILTSSETGCVSIPENISLCNTVSLLYPAVNIFEPA